MSERPWNCYGNAQGGKIVPLGVEVTAPLSVTEMGFSRHAATTASAEDSRGREALVRYALRPPIAQERLHTLPNDDSPGAIQPTCAPIHPGNFTLVTQRLDRS